MRGRELRRDERVNMSRKLTEKDMEIHREYMKKYKKDSSALTQEKMRYHDHYEVLGISREATHTEVIIGKPQRRVD